METPSIELKHGKIKKRGSTTKTLNKFRDPMESDVWISKMSWHNLCCFFRNRISASICLTFTQFSILSPLWRLPQIWFDVGWQWKKNNFGPTKKNQRLHGKGVEISLGLDPNLHSTRVHVPRKYSTTRLISKNVFYFAPSKKKGIQSKPCIFVRMFCCVNLLEDCWM